ncbi:MAG: cytochrome P450 [Acidimicrobiales bacterium]
MLSAPIVAEDAGDRLSHDELLDTTVLLFGAGHETTVNLISGGVLNLLRHPAELQRLRDARPSRPAPSRSCFASAPPSSSLLASPRPTSISPANGSRKAQS